MTAVSPEAARLSKLTTEQLCDEFLAEKSPWEQQSKRIGRIYYFLKLKFGGVPRMGKRDGSACGELRKRGVTQGMIAAATMSSRAYGLVADGKMTEEEYAGITYAQMKERFKDQLQRRPTCRTIERVTKSRDEALLETPIQSLDEGKSYARAMKALAVAQEWMIEARVSWPDGSPVEWDDRMTHALQYLGRIRLEITEAAAEEVKRPRSVLDLPKIAA